MTTPAHQAAPSPAEPLEDPIVTATPPLTQTVPPRPAPTAHSQRVRALRDAITLEV